MWNVDSIKPNRRCHMYLLKQSLPTNRKIIILRSSFATFLGKNNANIWYTFEKLVFKNSNLALFLKAHFSSKKWGSRLWVVKQSLSTNRQIMILRSCFATFFGKNIANIWYTFEKLVFINNNQALFLKAHFSSKKWESRLWVVKHT